MARTVLAAQLYTLREFTKTPSEVASTMKKVREMGYEAVQVSGFGPIEPEELKRIVDGEGIEICATHTSYERMRDEAQAVIDEHNLWGCKYCAIGSMPDEYRKGGEEVIVKFAKEASQVAKRLAEGGLVFGYHNHSFELRKLGKQTLLEILYAESDPKLFTAEIDTYWIQHGGGDPAAWIRRLKGRSPLVHLKDMGIAKGEQIMMEVGEGNLNWQAILDACREAGVVWYLVEQDICQRDPFESLAISLRNLKEMGLS